MAARPENQIKNTEIPRMEQTAEAISLDKALVDRFLAEKERQGCSSETLSTYQRNLKRLYHALPEGKRIGRGTLEAWREQLLESGYALRTVNGAMSAANSLLEYCGHREFQVQDLPAPAADAQPELTRSEYIRLLQAAKMQGKARTYLLVKSLALLGLGIQQLPRVTAEAVQQGRIVMPHKPPLYIPRCLRQELLNYAAERGIASGPLFITRGGTVLKRSAVTAAVQALAKDARVAPEKCNPRCLRRLYQTTRDGIFQNISILLDQAYDRMLENEQLTAGWAAT